MLARGLSLLTDLALRGPCPVGQRQALHQGHAFVEFVHETRNVKGRETFESLQVFFKGPGHRRQTRLSGTLHPLLGRLQGCQQRLGAAGQLGLLLRNAQGRLDVHHQGFIARARQALHQLFQLGALQSHLGEAGLHERDAGGAVLHDFL